VSTACPRCGHSPLRRCNLCPPNCASCEHAGLVARIKFTQDYEAIRERLEVAEAIISAGEALILKREEEVEALRTLDTDESNVRADQVEEVVEAFRTALDAWEI
jgi:hypothetical protein